MKQEIEVKRKFKIEAEYKKGITKIKIRKSRFKKEELEVNGIIIIALTTNKGNLTYGY